MNDSQDDDTRRLDAGGIEQSAVPELLEKNGPPLDASFGLWKERGEDGLAYEDRLRSEWRR